MQIIHINYSDRDSGGGGSLAMYRLHIGIKKAGLNSKILSFIKTSSQKESSLLPAPGKLEVIIWKITSKLGLQHIHNFNTFDIKKNKLYLESDIINFHVIHGAVEVGGFFSYLALSQLTESKPAVWTLHDMWGFTGHCAYSYDCDRWKTGCGKCPYPNTYPAVQRDNTRLEWKLKNWVYSRSNLTIVTPSIWLTEQAKQSMLSRFPIHHIPHGIDTDAYQPLEREQARFRLGIPTGKKVLMFGAEKLKDTRKGGDQLLKALSSLPASLKAETVLLTLGSGGEAIAEFAGITTLNLGYVSSDRLKSIAYSAADLFIFPTRADNLPLMLQESIACGTPIVSFKIGGVPDLVRPGITGYLAIPEDTKDFCNGIIQLIEDQNLRDRMSQQCRAIALDEYPLELQVKRYAELYYQILQN
jgi:glycosyltransferase involved in cell wall biosynthesis